MLLSAASQLWDYVTPGRAVFRHSPAFAASARAFLNGEVS